MNPNRTYEENMAALKKILTQRTYTALSHRNIEFVLKYQNASLQELAAYLRRQQQLQYFFPISGGRLFMPERMCLMKLIITTITKISNTHRQLMCRMAR